MRVTLRRDKAPLSDFRTAAADGGSLATITFDGPPVGYLWHISIISIDGGLATGIARFYLNAVDPTHQVDVAQPADVNTEDRQTWITVRSSCPLIVTVPTTNPGDIVTVRIEGTVERSP